MVRMCAGSGSCTRMPCTAGSALSLPISARSSASLVVLRQVVIDRHDAGGAGLPGLAFHIDLARRIGPDQHHRETRRDAFRRLQPAHLGADLLAKSCGVCGAVDDLRSHDVQSPLVCNVASRSAPTPFAWNGARRNFPALAASARPPIAAGPIKRTPPRPSPAVWHSVCQLARSEISIYEIHIPISTCVANHLILRIINSTHAEADPTLIGN